MKVVVAPDSYKGCLTAGEVAQGMASALRAGHPDWEVVELPLADGGDGTLDVLLPALRGEYRQARVHDPLGRLVSARWGLAGKTAVIEVAEACGLKLLACEERNPLVASTYGVGELLLAAFEAGARHLLIGLGGTATCDGGRGMLEVPGLVERMKGCTLELLCDVENPFIGPQGAAYIFAPQKGASEADVQTLECRMTEWAGIILERTGVDVREMPGAGAAGGLGGALMAFFGGVRVSGIDRMLDLLSFDSQVQGAGLIITGEGRSDLQTLDGKVALGVLKRAGGIPVALVSGRIQNREELRAAGFSSLVQITPDDMSMLEAVKPEMARKNLELAINAWNSFPRG